jgi:hypothetical protein
MNYDHYKTTNPADNELGNKEQPHMKTYTYQEIAESFVLWGEYVDPSGIDTEEAFDAMTTDEKIAFQEKCFGSEEPENEN